MKRLFCFCALAALLALPAAAEAHPRARRVVRRNTVVVAPVRAVKRVEVVDPVEVVEVRRVKQVRKVERVEVIDDCPHVERQVLRVEVGY